MELRAKCSAQIGRGNGIIKVLFTVSSRPNSADEFMLCNFLKSRGTLKEGKVYRITIEEE